MLLQIYHITKKQLKKEIIKHYKKIHKNSIRNNLAQIATHAYSKDKSKQLLKNFNKIIKLSDKQVHHRQEVDS